MAVRCIPIYSPTPGVLNPYQQAIQSVCSVLQPYDSDNMYPVYGFGAKVKDAAGKYTAVMHCFPVYGGGLEVQGVDGIMQVAEAWLCIYQYTV